MSASDSAADLASAARKLECQRGHFDLPEGEHYINCAYMAPMSKRVVAAGTDAIQRGMVPARKTVDDFFRGCDTVRALFAQLIGLEEPQRVAMVPAVSYGLAIVAHNTPLDRGQNVVALEGQFPSNMHAWRRLCSEAGATLRVVAPPVEGQGRQRAWNEAILEAIDGDTALVALGSVHWSDGTRFVLDRIGERAREVGAAFVLDGTQSVGADPFDVATVQPDALICGGYKWLMGPYSVGVAYFGPRYDSGTPLEETWMGKEGSDDFASLVGQGSTYRGGAARYDVGEAANFVLVPMLIAALEQVLGWGPEAIASYAGGLRDGLLESPRLEALGIDRSETGSRHLFGLRLPADRDPAQVQAQLAGRGVHVSVRGRVVRVSPHVYNDEGDLEALLEGLEAALG